MENEPPPSSSATNVHPLAYLIDTDPFNPLPLDNFLNYPPPGNLSDNPNPVELVSIIDIIIQLGGLSTPWRNHAFKRQNYSLRILQRINYWCTKAGFRDTGSVVYSLTVLYWHVCETMATVAPYHAANEEFLTDIIISGEMLLEATKMFTPSVYPRDVLWAQLRLCTAFHRISEGYKYGTFPITIVPAWSNGVSTPSALLSTTTTTTTTTTSTLPTSTTSNTTTTKSNTDCPTSSSLSIRLETDYLYALALRTGITNLALYVGSGAAGVAFPGISITEEARNLLISLRDRYPPVSSYVVGLECIRYLHSNGSTVRGASALLMVIRDCLAHPEVAILLNKEKGLIPLLEIMESHGEYRWSPPNSPTFTPADRPCVFWSYPLPSICEQGCAALMNLCTRPKVAENITMKEIKRILQIAISALSLYPASLQVAELAVRLIIHPCLIHHQYSISSTEIVISMGIFYGITRVLLLHRARQATNLHIFISEALELMSNSPSFGSGSKGSIKLLLEAWIKSLQPTDNNGTTNTNHPTTVEPISELLYTKLGKVAAKLLTYADLPEYTAVSTEVPDDLRIQISDPPAEWRETVLQFGMTIEDAFGST